MHTANIHRPTPAARQPFLTFPSPPTRLKRSAGPTHDFLMLSLCPEFMPEPAIVASANHRERPQNSASSLTRTTPGFVK